MDLSRTFDISNKEIMKAKDIKIGTKYRSGKTVQVVVSIEKITNTTIEYRTDRIFPDYYQGNFFNRKRLNTNIEEITY